jgi:hypothetical protein
MEEGSQGLAEYLLAETAKTLELQPVGLQILCIIGSSFGLFNSANSIFQNEVLSEVRGHRGCPGQRGEGPRVQRSRTKHVIFLSQANS